MKFSANLGFLWSDLSLPDGIRAAKAAGFDAVECHWPYHTPVEAVKAALYETDLAMLGLNTSRGNVASGENGLSALAGREGEARAAIDQAMDYAQAIGCPNIHVMAGFAAGEAAHQTFVENLHYACAQARKHQITILIEPLNANDAPGYFLQTTDQAIDIIKAIGADNIALMFDCYHVGRTEGDVATRIERLLPHIGHIQFASVPDRGTPDHGELNYDYIFRIIESLGYSAPLGAEYRPQEPTGLTLNWMQNYR